MKLWTSLENLINNRLPIWMYKKLRRISITKSRNLIEIDELKRKEETLRYPTNRSLSEQEWRNVSLFEIDS